MKAKKVGYFKTKLIMLNPKNVETTKAPQVEILSDDQLAQIKGGDGDTIIIDDIEI